MNICQYILQGIAHEIILFFNFIDFSWVFFAVSGFLLILACGKKVIKGLINFLAALFNIVRRFIVLLGIMLILSMYTVTTYFFKDKVSFYFILCTIISFTRDCYDFYKDTDSDISMKILVKNSLSLAKGTFLLLFIRIVNLIDVWDFSKLKYIYVYLLYLVSLLILSLCKKVYIIIDSHRCRCYIKGGHYNWIQLLFFYLYSNFYIKDLNTSSNMLFAFYNHERTTSFKTDLMKIQKLSIKLKSIMRTNQIDNSKLRRIGVEQYEQTIQNSV